MNTILGPSSLALKFRPAYGFRPISLLQSLVLQTARFLPDFCIINCSSRICTLKKHLPSPCASSLDKRMRYIRIPKRKKKFPGQRTFSHLGLVTWNTPVLCILCWNKIPVQNSTQNHPNPLSPWTKFLNFFCFCCQSYPPATPPTAISVDLPVSILCAAHMLVCVHACMHVCVGGVGEGGCTCARN